MSPKPIPAWNRFPKTVQVQRSSEESLDFVTVIENLKCRIYPRSQNVGDAQFASVVSGTHKLICDFDHVFVEGDLDASIQVGDKVIDDPAGYGATGQTFEYTVESISNPAGISYNAEIALRIRGQAEV